MASSSNNISMTSSEDKEDKEVKEFLLSTIRHGDILSSYKETVKIWVMGPGYELGKACYQIRRREGKIVNNEPKASAEGLDSDLMFASKLRNGLIFDEIISVREGNSAEENQNRRCLKLVMQQKFKFTRAIIKVFQNAFSVPASHEAASDLLTHPLVKKILTSSEGSPYIYYEDVLAAIQEISKERAMFLFLFLARQDGRGLQKVISYLINIDRPCRLSGFREPNGPFIENIFLELLVSPGRDALAQQTYSYEDYSKLTYDSRGRSTYTTRSLSFEKLVEVLQFTKVLSVLSRPAGAASRPSIAGAFSATAATATTAATITIAPPIPAMRAPSTS